MNRSALALLVVLGLFGLAAAPRAAHAQRDPDAARAAEHFSLAEAAERRGDWQTAILEYKRAHALKPHPSVLFNIAVDYEKLGDYANAADYFERYVRDSGGNPPDRAEVEARVAELRKKAAEKRQVRPGVGAGRLVVRANVDGAAVKVDDVLVGKTPLDVQVTAGPHRVTIEAPGHQTARRDVDIPSGGSEEIREFLAPTEGAGGDGGAGPGRLRFGFGFGFGFGLTEAETGRYVLGLSLRLPSDRLELGAYFGRFARNDSGLGLDARGLFSKSALKPFVRGAFTLGTATFGSDSYRTYGLEGGAGVLYSMAYARNPSTQRAVLTIEYYAEINARYTGGGVGEDLTMDSDYLTQRFVVTLDLGLWYRF